MITQRVAAGGLVVSAMALVSIALSEGFVPVAAPPVPGDVPTYGFGTTEGVKPGDKIAPPRALQLLARDASKAARAVQRCAPVPMYQHEFDAFVSLTYNIGESAFCGSTAARKLRAGDYAGACEEILRWNKFKGKPLPGLTNRRRSEYQTCITNPAAAPSPDTGSTESARGAGYL